jgi:hypothetical protein
MPEWINVAVGRLGPRSERASSSATSFNTRCIDPNGGAVRSHKSVIYKYFFLKTFVGRTKARAFRLILAIAVFADPTCGSNDPQAQKSLSEGQKFN